MENNISVNLENLSEEEREQLMKLIQKSNGCKRRAWKPENNETYFYISGCGVISSYKWINDTTDNGYYEIGNCFKTKEKAEFALEKVKVETELRRFAEENNEYEIDWKDRREKYFIYYDYIKEIISTSYKFSFRRTSAPFFTSKEIVEQAIKSIGEERLKKYYFGVDD